MAANRGIKVGDKVYVPMYPSDVVGEVLEVWGPRGRQSAMVRVPVLGPSGETLDEYDATLPLHRLRLAGADAA
jgi:hypothetical protein